MFNLGDTPSRWKRQRHFHAVGPGDARTTIPTCCGPWHNGAGHFVTAYICQDYWTILDPLVAGPYPRARRQLVEDNIHRVITDSFSTRGLPTPTLPTYRHVQRVAIQDDAPLAPWSCGTFAMLTTLNLLLGHQHPHELAPDCISRSQMLTLHRALLVWLITGHMPDLWRDECLLPTTARPPWPQRATPTPLSIAAAVTFPRGIRYPPPRVHA